jgi:deoxycytidylate deaminase
MGASASSARATVSRCPAARKAAAVLADQRVEAVGKARDPRVETGQYEDVWGA